MPGSAASEYISTLGSYFQVLERRKWLVLAIVVIVPIVAYFATPKPQVQYRASTLLLPSQSLAPLSGTLQAPIADSSTATQLLLARRPAVANIAIHLLHLKTTPGAFLAATGVGANADGSLTFSATATDPTAAAGMADGYAKAWARYRFTSGTAALAKLRRTVEARVAATTSAPIRSVLNSQLQAIDEYTALRTSAPQIVAIDGIARIGNEVKRNTLVGLVLGVVLAIGIAFLFDALDTRVLAAETIGEWLELPLLARLSKPPRKLRRRDGLVILSDPRSHRAEAFRVLRTNLEFASVGNEIRTVMVTSAVEQEGKSTTVANLAVAFARAGRRVLLIDLDLRRPYVHRFFGLARDPGVTDVALGRRTLEETLVPVSISPAEPLSRIGFLRSSALDVASPDQPDPRGGSLEVLTLGPVPSDPGEFVGGDAVAALLEEARARADIVLVDGPPLFDLGDGLVLGSMVDGIVVVARMRLVRRAGLTELGRLLDTIPAKKLGYVVADAEVDEGYGYGYGYGGYGSYGSYPRSYDQSQR